MEITARLEKPEHWELHEDGTPGSARILCGKRGPDGAQCCPGLLGYFYWPTARGRAYILRALPPARLSEHGVRHLLRHRQQSRQCNEQRWYIDLPTAEIPRGECPRCHTDQALLDAEDLDFLRRYAIIEKSE